MVINKILLNYKPSKKNLLAVIKEINKNKGFFSVEDAEKVASYFNVSVAEVFSAGSFYDEIRTKKPSNITVQFCDSPNCQSKNVEKIINDIEILYRQKVGDDNNVKLKIERISCLGRCLDGPIMVVNGNIYERMDSAMAINILTSYF
ncbi:MAG: NAD(P)H-dependent oxidoreductase subunit E [Patescibacteria group bacterium]|jgi:NADH:ubiquinone oxidoreductase subunit E|nr:NAD(P)H-dependent oxidoreductase subunit E [Patescibacteria group bacterium]